MNIFEFVVAAACFVSTYCRIAQTVPGCSRNSSADRQTEKACNVKSRTTALIQLKSRVKTLTTSSPKTRAKLWKFHASNYEVSDKYSKILTPTSEMTSCSAASEVGNPVEGCVANVNDCATLAANDPECEARISYFGWDKPAGAHPGRCKCVMLDKNDCGRSGEYDPPMAGWPATDSHVIDIQPIAETALAEDPYFCLGGSTAECNAEEHPTYETSVGPAWAGIYGNKCPECFCCGRHNVIDKPVAHLIDLGRGTDSPKCKSDQSTYAVRCCRDSWSKGWRKTSNCAVWGLSKPCQSKKNFVDAQQWCQSQGARLCTAEEIAQGCTQSTGCGFDNRETWTSTSCTLVCGDFLSSETCPTHCKWSGSTCKALYSQIADGVECEPNRWLGVYDSDPQVCMNEVLSRTECSKKYFNHATNGDNNCGCVTDLGKDCTTGTKSHWVVRIYEMEEVAATPGADVNLALTGKFSTNCGINLDVSASALNDGRTCADEHNPPSWRTHGGCYSGSKELPYIMIEVNRSYISTVKLWPVCWMGEETIMASYVWVRKLDGEWEKCGSLTYAQEFTGWHSQKPLVMNCAMTGDAVKLEKVKQWSNSALGLSEFEVWGSVDEKNEELLQMSVSSHQGALLPLEPTPAVPPIDQPWPICVVEGAGMVYASPGSSQASGLIMSGEEASIEVDAVACHDRCSSIKHCAYFTFATDTRNCFLQSADAVLRQGPSAQTQYGPRTCQWWRPPEFGTPATALTTPSPATPLPPTLEPPTPAPITPAPPTSVPPPSGEWKLIVNSDKSNFPNSALTSNLHDTNNPKSGKYIIVGDLSPGDYARNDEYTFKLVFKSSSRTVDMEWAQTSWLTDSSPAGFRAIAITDTDGPATWGSFNGLRDCGGNAAFCSMYGWWAAVGQASNYGGGIPAWPVNFIADSAELFISEGSSVPGPEKPPTTNWKIVGTDVYCHGGALSHQHGNTPNGVYASLTACQESCQAESACNFFLYRHDPLAGAKYTCATFPACDSSSPFGDGDGGHIYKKPDSPVPTEEELANFAEFQDHLVDLGDGPLGNMKPQAAGLGSAWQTWFENELLPAASATCVDCEIPALRDLMSETYPGVTPLQELCTCGDETIVSHVVNGLSRPWNCNERCHGLAPPRFDGETNPRCVFEVGTDQQSIQVPDYCVARVYASSSDKQHDGSIDDGGVELPAGQYSKEDLIARNILKSGTDTVANVKIVSNHPPDCTEEVLLRLLMIEHMEPGLDDSDKTEEEQDVYGNATRYGGIHKFRFSKMGTKIIRFAFHDAGDIDNVETLSGTPVDVGRTGLDGCLHTFREHSGTAGSFRMREDEPESTVWSESLPHMNIDHNKNIADDENIEVFLRLHSANDMADPKRVSANIHFVGHRQVQLNKRVPHFWTRDDITLPRLTRPDVLVLAANAAMEAMYDFGVPLEMKYGRWYGEECAGRRHEGDAEDAVLWFSAAGHETGGILVAGSRRRSWMAARESKALQARKTVTEGIESSGKYSHVMKVPFALHDDHKDTWCPSANKLPSVKETMGLTEAETVALYGAHSIGRVERAGKVRCNYLANSFFCPSMCPNINDAGGMRYAHGWVWDDTPEKLDNRYFANLMDMEFEELPHCVALGWSDSEGGPIPGDNPAKDQEAPWAHDEKEQGIVRFGVMGLGCKPQAWSPVVDPTLTRPCVAGYKIDWEMQSQCQEDNCIHDCITNNVCAHVWEDDSEDCRNCKFSCSNFFLKHVKGLLKFEGPRDPYSEESKLLSIEERWAGVALHAGPHGPGGVHGFGIPLSVFRAAPNIRTVTNASELKQFRWCKHGGTVEHNPQFGQESPDIHPWGKYIWNKFVPGPPRPSARSWAGPGIVQNMEQFAMLQGNPTPIFNLPVDFSLLGEESTKKWVRTFGTHNDRFQLEFANAWKKVTAAGWDTTESKKPQAGWSGSKLASCQKTKCTAKAGKFWCPINVFDERLRYLPKPASLRLELGNCKAAADSTSSEGTPVDSQPGACELIGGFGVRGTVQCGTKKYHCCSERACAWETWLEKHREADKSHEATCPFTKEEKAREVERTKAKWGPHASSAGSKSEDLGIDFTAAQKENWKALFAHEKRVKGWFEDRDANKTLSKEFTCPWSPSKCYSCKQHALNFLIAPTGGTTIHVNRGLIFDEMPPAQDPHIKKPI